MGPALEPAARGGGVERKPGRHGWRDSLGGMLSRVEEHVGERGPNLPGRAEAAVVIPPVEHRSPPPEDPVHRSREARGDALHAACESRRVRRFDQEVDVIVLDRVVNDAEVGSFRTSAKGALQFPHQSHASQGRNLPANANRDEPRVSLGKLCTGAVPHSRSQCGLSSGSRPRATPACRLLQFELELRATRHTLDYGYVFVGSQEESSRLWKTDSAVVSSARFIWCGVGRNTGPARRDLRTNLVLRRVSCLGQRIVVAAQGRRLRRRRPTGFPAEPCDCWGDTPPIFVRIPHFAAWVSFGETILPTRAGAHVIVWQPIRAYAAGRGDLGSRQPRSKSQRSSPAVGWSS